MTIARILSATLLAVFHATPVQAFDQATINATKVCHDYVWFQVPEFENVPNAAVSAFPGAVDSSAYTIYWVVRWDDPRIRAAGDCTVKDGEVRSFEDYTKQ